MNMKKTTLKYLDCETSLMYNYKSIINRKIRVGVVGCGRISQNHFKSISQMESDLELVAVCDVDRSKTADYSGAGGVGCYDDLEQMLIKENLDVVVLCTPSGLHAKQTILIARYKIHIITEKPMATRYADGLDMVRACDVAGVRLFVVKQNRHNATLKLLKKAVAEKRFGEIKMVHMNVFWTRPQDYYDQGNGWRGTWEYDGGAFMNQASHYVDLIDWLIGPVESIQAMMSTSRRIEAEDSGVLNIKWRNGALGSMAVTMLTFPENLEGSITILGDRGTARVGGVAVNEIQVWNFEDTKNYDEEILNASYATTSVYGFGHPIYYQNVVDVLRGRAEPNTDGRSGLKSMELLTAAYMAARDKVTVNLPLQL